MIENKVSSIPLSAIRLGINLEGYNKLIKNVGRMMLIPLWQRREKINEANQTLSKKTMIDALSLIEDLAYEKKAYEPKGLQYHEGPPKGQLLFKTAVVDYLLTN